MKRIVVILIVSLLVLGSVFGATYYHHHNWSSWYTRNTEGRTVETYSGSRAYTYARGNGVGYTMYAYGLGASDSAWNRYVNSDYSLRFIGGTYYFSGSDSWSEPGNINSYLYPAYINYLRPQ